MQFDRRPVLAPLSLHEKLCPTLLTPGHYGVIRVGHIISDNSDHIIDYKVEDDNNCQGVTRGERPG